MNILIKNQNNQINQINQNNEYNQNNKSYSLLLLHEYHLKNYSLYELYILRNNIYLNNNYINQKLPEKPLQIIDNAISNKYNGDKLLKLINQINNTTIKIEECKSEREKEKYLLTIFEYISICENIFQFEKDSLLETEQKILKYYLIFINKFYYYSELILYCEFDKLFIQSNKDLIE